jgi:hypothetical protein
MYEYTAQRTSGQFVMPVVGASFNRIFDCATDEEYGIVRPSPPHHGAVAISGGVRLALFRGQRAAGSLKVLYVSERLQGLVGLDDQTNHGVTVGVVIHGR